MNLARAFSYAGAKEIVPTLWNISDESTAVLMKKFYQQINSGKATAQALRNAKINTITTADIHYQAHPYYWAAFIDIGGATENISVAQSNWWILALAVVLLLFLVGIRKKFF